jgi:DNA-binding response OmpR family regulator
MGKHLRRIAVDGWPCTLEAMMQNQPDALANSKQRLCSSTENDAKVISDPLAILIVEDESLARVAVRAVLLRMGFRVLEAESGEKGLEIFNQAHPCGVVLDIMLPGMNGFEVCTQMRASAPGTAIIMLTAMGQDADKIKGLDLGADDYIVKPFNPDELVARIKAVLRRSQNAPLGSEVLRTGEFRIEWPFMKCFKRDRELDLTPREITLLTTFMQNPGKTLSREELSERIWSKIHFGSEKGLDVIVHKLREKIEDDPSRPVYLRTVWGTGYIWICPSGGSGVNPA